MPIVRMKKVLKTLKFYDKLSPGEKADFVSCIQVGITKELFAENLCPKCKVKLSQYLDPWVLACHKCGYVSVVVRREY